MTFVHIHPSKFQVDMSNKVCVCAAKGKDKNLVITVVSCQNKSKHMKATIKLGDKSSNKDSKSASHIITLSSTRVNNDNSQGIDTVEADPVTKK